MKRVVVFGVAVVLAGPVLAADPTPKDEVAAAAKQLAEAENYGWTTTVDSAGGFRPGPTHGKTNKEGLTSLSMTFFDNEIEAVLKGDKGVFTTPDGWTTIAEAAESEPGQQNPGRFIALMLRNYRVPAADAADLLAHAKELKKQGDAYTAELTEDGVKARLSFRGGNANVGGSPRGSVTFWIKDGMLVKYEYTVVGTVNFNGNDFDVDRTTTVEIKDVGKTEVEVSEEARKKLS